jgi:hypothetical protein
MPFRFRQQAAAVRVVSNPDIEMAYMAVLVEDQHMRVHPVGLVYQGKVMRGRYMSVITEVVVVVLVK